MALNDTDFRLEMAVYFYSKDRFSMRQAKQLSGLDQLIFQKELAKRNVDVRLSEAELEKEFVSIGNLRKKLRL